MPNLAKIHRKFAKMQLKWKIQRKLSENPPQIQRKATVAAKCYKIQAKTTLRDPTTRVEGGSRGASNSLGIASRGLGIASNP